MAKDTVAVFFALAAALFIAIGDVIHQRSAHDVTAEPVGQIALFARLLRDRAWWRGTVLAAVGFGLQAAALAFGSVLLVETLLVTSLLFALVINARVGRAPVARSVWLWAVLLAGAVSLIITVGNPTAGHSRASVHSWVGVVAVLAPAVLACLWGARIGSARTRALLLAAVSGVCWGMFAVLTKGVVGQADHGVAAVAVSPEFYLLVAVTLGGTVTQQASFRSGALTASLPTMTVLEPVVAATLSVVLLGEGMRPGPAGWFVLAAAVLVTFLAAVVLSRSEAVAGSRPDS